MTQASPTIDLGSCEREPIRTPGSIQPHGCVLALSAEGIVVQVSDNVERWMGVAPSAALGRPLHEVIDAGAAARLAPELPAAGERPSFAATVRLPGGVFDVLVHRYDALLMLEFEAVQRTGAADFRHLYPLVGNFLQQLDDSDPVETMSARAADEIRGITGFNRVLVYRFDAEGHGHVLAESNDGQLPSYLGQRFPASDIPRQARELYASNRIRLIHDADYAPSRLVPAENPLTGAPNDLSFAALRSVSPVHLQYMRNMGTLASMSVSLMVKGQLWGLISCHNAAPRHVTFDKRTACEQLGQILALRVESREVRDELQFRLDVRRIMVTVLAGLTQGANFIDNMGSVFPELLHFARAGGAAIIVDDRIVSYGDTPDEAQLRELIAWLQANSHEDLYHTDRLSAEFAPAAAYRQSASGLLAMPISRIHKHYLLWFRPEFVYTIDWAGNPHAKDAVPGAPTQLSPRTSFDSWRETVHGTSAPWHPGEIEMALEFRTALLGIALERAEQMAELAEELGRANKELEAFSYSVSHDLRAPLRHIVGFSDLLLEAGGAGSPEKQQRFLVNIKESARLAGKLVDDLLSFSQMGRASLRPVQVDMNELVRSCIDKMALDIGSRRIEWHVADLPPVAADPTFIQLALYNLLSNAVKFTSQKDPAVIRIDGRREAGVTVFTVADNGVGFNMDYVHKLFGVFQRLHRMEDFQGTGIGLANVRRIVERHGGAVTAAAVPGQGATFTFSIPNSLPTVC
ncbi:ATP-binding protein [Pseudoduganella umbonata]|uniref:histidine kinase n=1 Tax=Pseudoduganella umbonata TaxID=864828 RepID=A0A4P8HMP8_9BURK|nr:ATP-binding protein [Pseudoduganella umbonata]MBB3222484.1 light-regulated signal transduction histidine kinase (bacteriophytochrome) [Pseudoduganella umbonata]QCP10979.1 GAF domain-containing protein [Pseudoduganella umbonata]